MEKKRCWGSTVTVAFNAPYLNTEKTAEAPYCFYAGIFIKKLQIPMGLRGGKKGADLGLWTEEKKKILFWDYPKVIEKAKVFVNRQKSGCTSSG